jgi:hypothetical protein
MESSGHRANILAKTWDSAGVGAYKGSDGAIRYTVLFMQSAKKPATQTGSLSPAVALGWASPFAPDGAVASAADVPRVRPEA